MSLIVFVRKVTFYIGNEEIHLRELTMWDEELLGRASLIYCSVEGHPPPIYTIWSESRDEEVEYVIRDYFPYWENDENNTRWAALSASDVEWGRDFNLTCLASLGNESISATIHFSGLNACFGLHCKYLPFIYTHST